MPDPSNPHAEPLAAEDIDHVIRRDLDDAIHAATPLADPAVGITDADLIAALDRFELRLRDVQANLTILSREQGGRVDHPIAAPVKRWPFRESPGDLANRLFDCYTSIARPVREAMLVALRTVLIEQPPALASWLDPGAAAEDSKTLHLLIVALRHAFPDFQDDAPITTERVLAVGKKFNEAMLGIRSNEPKQNRASDAQRQAALVALKDHVHETTGPERTLADYVRLANYVADAVVGAEP